MFFQFPYSKHIHFGIRTENESVRAAKEHSDDDTDDTEVAPALHLCEASCAEAVFVQSKQMKDCEKALLLWQMFVTHKILKPTRFGQRPEDFADPEPPVAEQWPLRGRWRKQQRGEPGAGGSRVRRQYI